MQIKCHVQMFQINHVKPHMENLSLSLPWSRHSKESKHRFTFSSIMVRTRQAFRVRCTRGKTASVKCTDENQCFLTQTNTRQVTNCTSSPSLFLILWSAAVRFHAKIRIAMAVLHNNMALHHILCELRPQSWEFFEGRRTYLTKAAYRVANVHRRAGQQIIQIHLAASKAEDVRWNRPWNAKETPPLVGKNAVVGLLSFNGLLMNAGV